MEISASFIRQSIKAKKDVRFMLPQAVFEFMEEMNFYKKWVNGAGCWVPGTYPRLVSSPITLSVVGVLANHLFPTSPLNKLTG